MRHVILTCRNHTNLRWSCKEEAVCRTTVGEPAGYTGSRNIFFKGQPTDKGMYSDFSGLDCSQVTPEGKIIVECDCPASDLIIAPEDAFVKRCLTVAERESLRIPQDNDAK